MPGVYRSSINLTRWRGAVPNALNAGRVDAFLGAGALADVQAGLAREATLTNVQSTVNGIAANGAQQATLAAVQGTVNAINANGAQQSTLAATQTTVNGIAANQPAQAQQTTLTATQNTVNAIYNAMIGPGLDIESVVAHGINNDIALDTGQSTGISNLPWAVNRSKTLLVNLSPQVGNIRFLNDTQIEGRRPGASSPDTIGYSLVEFK